MKNEMKIGDLVRLWINDNRSPGGRTPWLLLNIIEDSVLVINTRSSYKMWAKKNAFMVIQ